MYDSQKFKTLAGASKQEVINNQVILTGTDKLILDNGVFMLEYFSAAAPIIISDGENKAICTVQEFSQDHSPLRCNKGVQFSGAILMAKGYKVEGVL